MTWAYDLTSWSFSRTHLPQQSRLPNSSGFGNPLDRLDFMSAQPNRNYRFALAFKYGLRDVL